MYETINVIVDEGDEGDDSEEQDDRAEMEQRVINNRALGPDSIKNLILCFLL